MGLICPLLLNCKTIPEIYSSNKRPESNPSAYLANNADSDISYNSQVQKLSTGWKITEFQSFEYLQMFK